LWRSSNHWGIVPNLISFEWFLETFGYLDSKGKNAKCSAGKTRNKVITSVLRLRRSFSDLAIKKTSWETLLLLIGATVRNVEGNDLKITSF
tara:strand:+ start:141 stop:413 length:273 start_codon:yes stop_codon:yes gene_type:complete